MRQSIKSQSTVRLEGFARQHRCAPTESEARLWAALKRRQLGVSFRWQVPLGGRFIADFFASSVRLVVEVDGGSHSSTCRSDELRDRKLARLGMRTVRVTSELVLRDLAAAVAQIRAAL